jgi:hypothetical protein
MRRKKMVSEKLKQLIYNHLFEKEKNKELVQVKKYVKLDEQVYPDKNRGRM